MMNVYTQHILQIVVAQICDTVGWHSVQSTPLELLMDLLHRHLTMTATSLRGYSELFGRSEPNLNDLGLVFQDHKISIPDLEEYVQYVEAVPFAGSVPKLPIPKDSHLNFLKPGSREVLTRPVHIHEYLPPMYPDLEAEEEKLVAVKTEDDKIVTPAETITNNNHQDGVFKRPNEPINEPSQKRIRIIEEECSARPTREISSVMMTTSGFISPAREGKLPEARSPVVIMESTNYSLTNTESVVPEQVLVKDEHKKVKKVKGTHGSKAKDKSKKKNKEMPPVVPNITSVNQNDMSPSTTEKRKKVVSMKEVLKNKALKTGVVKTDINNQPQDELIDIEEDDVKPIDFTMENLQKTLPKSAYQTQIFQNPPPIATTSASQPPVTIEPVKPVEESVEKLPTANASSNDRQKLSVFKKKNKVKEEKFSEYNNLNQEVKIEPPFEVTDVVERPPLNCTPVPTRMMEEVDEKPVLVKSEIPSEEELARPISMTFAETNHFREETPPIKLEKDKKKPKKDKGKSKKVKKVVKTENVTIVDSDESDFAEEVQQQPPTTFCPPGLNPYLGVPYSPFANSPSLIPNPNLFTQLISSPVNKVFPRFPFPMHSGFPLLCNSMPPMGMFLNQNQGDSEPEEKVTELPKAEEPPPPIVPVCNVPPLVLPTEEEMLSPPKPTTSEPPPPKVETPVVEKKKDKEHKKDKKDKEERTKKKKDKKDKVKNKDKEKKREKDKEKSEKKKEKKEKKREERDTTDGGIPKLTLKFGPMDSSSPRPATPDSTGSRKITIKPLAPRTEVVEKPATPPPPPREPSPELAKISALYTRPPKPKIPKLNNSVDVSIQDPNQPVASTSGCSSRESRNNRKAAVDIPPLPPPPPTKSVDQFGNEVWICPGCGRQDDGSPMIGCDDCDAWYHWVCVGIQIPPDQNEDWYCSHCIQRKKQQVMLDSDKKRKRKKSKKAH